MQPQWSKCEKKCVFLSFVEELVQFFGVIALAAPEIMYYSFRQRRVFSLSTSTFNVRQKHVLNIILTSRVKSAKMKVKTFAFAIQMNKFQFLK